METIAVVILALSGALSIGVFFIAYRAWRNRENEESLKDAEAAEAFKNPGVSPQGGGGPKPVK